MAEVGGGGVEVHIEAASAGVLEVLDQCIAECGLCSLLVSLGRTRFYPQSVNWVRKVQGIEAFFAMLTFPAPAGPITSTPNLDIFDAFLVELQDFSVADFELVQLKSRGRKAQVQLQ